MNTMGIAALIDVETKLKRFLVHKGKPFLRAEKPKYPDLIPAHELVIQGGVSGALEGGQNADYEERRR